MQRSSAGGLRPVVQRCACPVDSKKKNRDLPQKKRVLSSFFLLIDSCCETCRFARPEHSLRRANSGFEPLAVFSRSLGAKLGSPRTSLYARRPHS